MTEARILALLGSLRAESVNRQILELAGRVGSENAVLTRFEGLETLPFYNEDLDSPGDPTGSKVPAPVVALRVAAAEADAVLIVTPEYNGSIPALVKNAIDWLSRPYGDSALSGKPAAVIGAALGRHGGLWAHDETRKALGVAGARVVEDITLSMPLSALAGSAVAENAELAANVREAVEVLVAAVR